MLTDLFLYHYDFNDQLIDQFENHQSLLPEKTFSLFCHVLNAHQIWNARILGKKSLDVWQKHSFEDCRMINQENFESSIQIMATVDLESTTYYIDSKGNSHSNLVKDILVHVANHSSHHKGQIIADFRSSGIEPLVTDYIYYKRT